MPITSAERDRARLRFRRTHAGAMNEDAAAEYSADYARGPDYLPSSRREATPIMQASDVAGNCRTTICIIACLRAKQGILWDLFAASTLLIAGWRSVAALLSAASASRVNCSYFPADYTFRGVGCYGMRRSRSTAKITSISRVIWRRNFDCVALPLTEISKHSSTPMTSGNKTQTRRAGWRWSRAFAE